MSPSLRATLHACQQINPNHHLWNNNGTWWFHCTIHRPDYTKERVRRSLGTSDVKTARSRRDEHLAQLSTRGDLRLSIRSGRPGERYAAA